jgi:hypothetical protein
MRFMMLMIPAVYQGGKPAPGFTPDPKKMEEMDRFNKELGKAFKIESLNGLHPLYRKGEFAGRWNFDPCQSSAFGQKSRRLRRTAARHLAATQFGPRTATGSAIVGH